MNMLFFQTDRIQSLSARNDDLPKIENDVTSSWRMEMGADHFHRGLEICCIQADPGRHRPTSRPSSRPSIIRLGAL